MKKNLNKNDYTLEGIIQRKSEIENKLNEDSIFIKEHFLHILKGDSPKNNAEKFAKYAKMGYGAINSLFFALKLYKNFKGKKEKKKKTKKWFPWIK